MAFNNNDIKRGDIFICDLEPAKGVEKTGSNRPVLIIQNNLGNKYSPATIGVVLTKEYNKKDLEIPTNVLIKKDKINNLDYDSLIETNQIRILDVKKRLIKKIGRVDKTTLYKIDKALKVSLGLIEECPTCGFMLIEEYEICPKCKLKLFNKCVECNELLKTNWKFCPLCGKEV